MKEKRISFGQGKGSLTHNNREISVTTPSRSVTIARFTAATTNIFLVSSLATLSALLPTNARAFMRTLFRSARWKIRDTALRTFSLWLTA